MHVHEQCTIFCQLIAMSIMTFCRIKGDYNSRVAAMGLYCVAISVLGICMVSASTVSASIEVQAVTLI